ncbi:glycosyltransferase family 2 protein [Candidatus Poribacteria bacterium]|nr:glycosyltransferase family 2 protein [Candidatus Poribacteria bacterium]
MSDETKNHNISIIIPVYNRTDKLLATISSIYDSDYRNYEIIIVDDGSEQPIDITKNNKLSVIRLHSNQGPSAARNAGAAAARGEIFLFIDSDILIKKNTLSYINNLFSTSNVDCLTGLYSMECPNTDLFSKFKNLFIRYSFIKMSCDVSCLHSSITAMKKEVFEKSGGFDKTRKRAGVEDIIYGQQLKNMGYKIFFDNNLEVIHDKKYNMKNLIINDFRKGSEYIEALFDYNWIFTILKKKDHPNSNRNFILSIPLIYLFLIFFTLFIATKSLDCLSISLICFFLFIASQWNFIYYLAKSEGLFFSLECLPIVIINNIVFGLAILNGIFLHLIKSHKK